MKRRIVDESGLIPVERDACAIICYANKAGKPTHGNLQRTIEALVRMGHRAGEINGEGDGCGILTDIPRLLWREALAETGYAPELADSPRVAGGRLRTPKDAPAHGADVQAASLRRFSDAGVEVLLERPGVVR